MAEPEVFRHRNLRGARFVESDLSGAVMRGVSASRLDIDAPWLPDDDGLIVNGVDVTGYVEAELDRRFPGRAERRAADPGGLQSAWAALQAAWEAELDRVSPLPAEVVDTSVDGEWSFAQTLRHLVLATDLWLGKAVLRLDDPFHPLGLRDTSSEVEAGAAAAADVEPPAFADVVAAWRERAAMVREFVDSATPELLDQERPNPHDDSHPETVRSCVHVVLEESWEHLRFAQRDLGLLGHPR